MKPLTVKLTKVGNIKTASVDIDGVDICYSSCQFCASVAGLKRRVRLHTGCRVSEKHGSDGSIELVLIP